MTKNIHACFPITVSLLVLFPFIFFCFLPVSSAVYAICFFLPLVTIWVPAPLCSSSPDSSIWRIMISRYIYIRMTVRMQLINVMPGCFTTWRQSYAIRPMSWNWVRSVGVIFINGIICSIPVQVDAPRVPNGVARHEPPLLRVVVTVGTQHQPRLGVTLIPPLRPEPPRVTRRGRAGARPEGVVEVGGQDAAARVEALIDVAALVEGVEDAGPRGRGVAGDEAIGPKGVEGLDIAAGVEFGHGVRAVVEVVGPRPGVGLLPGPQAVALVVRPGSL